MPQGVCALGYTGVLCYKCSNGFSKISNEKCTRCSGAINMTLMFLKMALRIVIYFYMIMKGYLLCDNLRRTENKISSGIVISNFLIKILILHAQFLRTLLGFPFKLGNLLQDFLSVFSFSIDNDVKTSFNFECFIVDDFPVKYLYNTATIMMPLLISVIIWSFAKIKGCIKPREKKEKKEEVVRKTLNVMPSRFISALRRNTSEHVATSLRNLSVTIRNSPLTYLVIIAFMIFYNLKIIKFKIQKCSSQFI